jgi:hypothetical protein
VFHEPPKEGKARGKRKNISATETDTYTVRVKGEAQDSKYFVISNTEWTLKTPANLK